MSSFFQIGLYQLENLLIARPSFRFLDVRLQPRPTSVPRVQNILAHATIVSSHQALNFLRNNDCRADEPIVLLCEDGRLSQSVATSLEAAGFQQIYITEGGLDGLIREAAISG